MVGVFRKQRNDLPIVWEMFSQNMIRIHHNYDNHVHVQSCGWYWKYRKDWEKHQLNSRLKS